MRQHVFAVACLSTCLVMSTLAKAAEKVVAPLGIAQDKNGDQKKATPIAPAEALAEGWEEIDERLIFLMVRLANTESSLEAVEKVIAANSRKRTAKTSEAKRAIGENEKMDRKGGGPMKWSQFYGTTAEKFFYHPTDRNSTYHTETILSPQPPQNDNQTGPGIPSRQGLPVHQRPPQFDYIYKANETVMARADAEAAQLKNKVEALTERRQKLEQEQVALWIEIAFRVAAHFDIDKKPMFRFEPQIAGDDAESQLHADMLKSAASFMRVALAIVEEANTDQEATLLRIKPAVKEARQTLNDSWLRLAVDTADKTTTEGKFAALAKRLDDVSSNLTESYEFANEGDQEQDVIRKETFRGLLQESLIRYAQIILAMDEMATEMKDKWNIKPDLDKPFGAVSLASIEVVRVRSNTMNPPSSKPMEQNENRIGSTLFRGHNYKVFLEAGLDWATAKTRCEAMGGHLVTISDEQENNFIAALATKTISDINNSGIWLGATDERNEGQWEWLDRTQFRYTTWFDGQPNGKERENHLLLLLSFRNAQGNEIRGWCDQPMAGKVHVIYYACEWDSVAVTTSPSEGSPRNNSLFDGNSLDGWHTDSNQWQIKKGVLTGEKLDPNESGSFLISDKTYRDFELYAEFRLLEGNSGIQIRSLEDSTGVVTGPQADIAYHDNFRFHGCLTGERIQPGMIAQTSEETKAQIRQVVNPNGWNSIKVSVEGRQASIVVNNVNTVQASLPDGYDQGVIALQLHGGGRTRIEFRKIEIVEITADDAFDPFKQKSVWSDGGLKLTVIDRRGGTFRGKLETSEWARNIRGTIKDGQVTWLAKDVQPITGGVGGDNYGTISSDENGYRIDVEWTQPNGKSGTQTYRLNK